MKNEFENKSDKIKLKEIIRRMLDDKKMIFDHISNGGKIKDLESKGVRVAKAV